MHKGSTNFAVKTEHSKTKPTETYNYLFENALMTLDLIIV
jgi:hypothetical protein